MAYFQFDSPLESRKSVNFHFNNTIYDGFTTVCDPYYVVFPCHRDVCHILSDNFPKEFKKWKRGKCLAKFNYEEDTGELFPEFPTLKDLEDFLNYFNDKYSEL